MQAGTDTDGARPPLLARLGLWRLTRHPAVRRCYDTLADRGLFFAQLDRFERPSSPDDRDRSQDPPPGVTLRVETPGDHRPNRLRDAPLAPADQILLAIRGGEAVGHCCLSDRPVYVPELHRRLRLPGAYCWGLFVEPSARGDGIGTSLVAETVRLAARTDGTDSIAALVAPDNLPSRRAFRSHGFAPTKRYTSAGVAGRRWHRTRDLRTDL